MTAAMPESAALSPDTRAQIAATPFGGRPLVICDVDEVVLSFIAPLERHLDLLGYDLLARSYSLAGNIIHRQSNTPLAGRDVHALLHSFFAEATATQTPVPGAADALAALSLEADVVLLTNMPAPYRADRIAALARFGIDHPVITNEGPKGAAARELAERSAGPVVFLDDSPANITSVRDAVDGVRLIHFVADPRFLALAEPIDGVDLRTGDWREARRFVETVCGGTAPGAARHAGE